VTNPLAYLASLSVTSSCKAIKLFFICIDVLGEKARAFSPPGLFIWVPTNIRLGWRLASDKPSSLFGLFVSEFKWQSYKNISLLY
jgi:hypothetical protein